MIILLFMYVFIRTLFVLVVGGANDIDTSDKLLTFFGIILVESVAAATAAVCYLVFKG